MGSTLECQCSLERVERALLLIGEEELKHLVERPEETTVRCEFCSKEYKISKVELDQLIQRLKK